MAMMKPGVGVLERFDYQIETFKAVNQRGQESSPLEQKGDVLPLKAETQKSIRKILVVDDNQEFGENVKEVLELYGYQVRTAYDGYKAIDQVKQEPPDVVILDVKLPGIDGLATFRKIKEIAPDTAVIMITGYAVDEIVNEAISEGACASLQKPLDFDKLLALIEHS